MAEFERMPGLYRDLYRGFTVKHFREQLGKRHHYTLGYTVTKLHLHRVGWDGRMAPPGAEPKKAETGGQYAIRSDRPIPNAQHSTKPV